MVQFKSCDLHYFAHDDTIALTCDNLTDLLKTIGIEPEAAADCFRRSEIIVNAKNI